MQLLITVSADYIHVCHRSNPDINKCINESIYNLKPLLASGIEELHVPALEPLALPDQPFKLGPADEPANITNLNIWGGSTFEILDLK